ncbi:hypothetical protein NL676_003178 [Syzygium grande]|nr:hypothetical protein NL676_003178 [Syzygium grande]
MFRYAALYASPVRTPNPPSFGEITRLALLPSPGTCCSARVSMGWEGAGRRAPTPTPPLPMTSALAEAEGRGNHGAGGSNATADGALVRREKKRSVSRADSTRISLRTSARVSPGVSRKLARRKYDGEDYPDEGGERDLCGS